VPQICQTRFWVPLCKLVEWVTGARSQLVNDIRVVRSFAASIVEARQRQQQQQQQPSAKGPAASAPAHAGAAGQGVGGSSGHGGGADLLSMFLAAETEDGQPLGKEQLVDMVLNFIIAGRDTTAQVSRVGTLHRAGCRMLLCSCRSVSPTAAAWDNQCAYQPSVMTDKLLLMCCLLSCWPGTVLGIPPADAAPRGGGEAPGRGGAGTGQACYAQPYAALALCSQWSWCSSCGSGVGCGRQQRRSQSHQQQRGV
jgi:hypothetical protein